MSANDVLKADLTDPIPRKFFNPLSALDGLWANFQNPAKSRWHSLLMFGR